MEQEPTAEDSDFHLIPDGAQLLSADGAQLIQEDEQDLSEPIDDAEPAARLRQIRQSFQNPVSRTSTMPVFLRAPSTSQQVSIAYFPMGPPKSFSADRIESVSRNSADGRIRCELKDSTIHGREESGEGIPIDYHLVWESSPVPVDTFRNNYYVLKKNGKLFLTPLQVVHMRTVLEAKGVRANEQQRVGIVSQTIHQDLAASASAGKWVNYEVNPQGSSSAVHFAVDERDIRQLYSTPQHPVADSDAVVKAALSLGSVSSEAVVGGGGKNQRPTPGIEKIENIFKSRQRIHRTSDVERVAKKPLKDVLDGLKSCAYLVHGNWVGRGSLFFKSSPPDKTKVPFHVYFDYFLYHFSIQRVLDVSSLTQRLGLNASAQNGILMMIAKHDKSTRWKFLADPDDDFIDAHPTLVKEQQTAWEERKVMMDKIIEEAERLKAAAGAVTRTVTKVGVAGAKEKMGASTPSAGDVNEQRPMPSSVAKKGTKRKAESTPGDEPASKKISPPARRGTRSVNKS